jgi:fatty acid-binding protein DegV
LYVVGAAAFAATPSLKPTAFAAAATTTKAKLLQAAANAAANSFYIFFIGNIIITYVGTNVYQIGL